MYCAECGTANPMGAETCEVCGSPLGPSSGDQSCHVCGAPVDEHDRFCRACGQSQSGAEAGRYEPGPSFVDDSALEVDSSELPPWLREMTVTATENGNNGHVTASTSVAEKSESLPPWLDSAPPSNGATHKAPTFIEPAWSNPAPARDEPAESFSLISEDDLPEWLRALGDQEFQSEPEPEPLVMNRQTAQPSIAAAIPTVSRAWLSRARDPETESADEVAADFAPLETGVTAGLQRKTMPQTDDLGPLPVSEQAPAEMSAPVDESSQTNTRRVRLIMLSVVVLLVVVLGYYAVSNFL